MLGFYLQNVFEFGGSIAGFRALDQRVGCIEQVPKTREPHRSGMPKAQGIKFCNGPQRVILASMRIAAQIVQFCQLTENCTASWIAQGFFKLIKGGNFMPYNELMNCSMVFVEYFGLFIMRLLAHVEKYVKANCLKLIC